MTNLQQVTEEAIARFNVEYRKAYAGILPEEMLAQGNPWLENFIRNLLLAQRTHIKQALREEILRKIVPSNYEHLPEHARAGAVLQDILHIINIINEELA